MRPSRRPRHATPGAAPHTRSRTVFSATLPDARFTFAGETAPQEVRDFLNRTVAAAMRAPRDFTCPALQVVTSARDVLWWSCWRPVHDGAQMPTGVLGFTTDPAFMTHLFEGVMKKHPLLPPSLTRASADPNNLLALRVATPDGRQLFSSTTDWSSYAADQQLQKDLGGLKLSVALRPDAAGRLSSADCPRERLPLVVGLAGVDRRSRRRRARPTAAGSGTVAAPRPTSSPASRTNCARHWRRSGCSLKRCCSGESGPNMKDGDRSRSSRGKRSVSPSWSKTSCCSRAANAATPADLARTPGAPRTDDRRGRRELRAARRRPAGAHRHRPR